MTDTLIIINTIIIIVAITEIIMPVICTDKRKGINSLKAGAATGFCAEALFAIIWMVCFLCGIPEGKIVVVALLFNTVYTLSYLLAIMTVE